MDLGLEKAFSFSLNVSLSDAVGSSKHGRKHSMFIINICLCGICNYKQTKGRIEQILRCSREHRGQREYHR